MEPAYGGGSFMPWLCSVSTPACSIPHPLIPPLVPLFQSKGSLGKLAFKDGLALRSCIHAEQTKHRRRRARGSPEFARIRSRWMAALLCISIWHCLIYVIV